MKIIEYTHEVVGAKTNSFTEMNSPRKFAATDSRKKVMNEAEWLLYQRLQIV